MSVVVIDGQIVHRVVGIGIQGPPGPGGVPFRGLTYRTTAGNISFSGVATGTFKDSGLTGTLDVNTNEGVDNVTGSFGLSRTAAGSGFCYIVATADIAPEQKKRVGIKLALNGVPIDASECNVTVDRQSVGKLHSMYVLELEQGDEVTMWFANYTSQATVPVERARMMLIGVA